MSGVVLALLAASALAAAPDIRPVVYVGPVTAKGVPEDTAGALVGALSTVLLTRMTNDLVLTDAERERSILEIKQQAAMLGMDGASDEPVDACGKQCVCRSSVASRIRYFVHVEVTQTPKGNLEVAAKLAEKDGKLVGASVKITAKDGYDAVDQMPALAASLLKILDGARGAKR